MAHLEELNSELQAANTLRRLIAEIRKRAGVPEVVGFADGGMQLIVAKPDFVAARPELDAHTIAKAAYFRAGKHDLGSASEHGDWLYVEREVSLASAAGPDMG